MYRRNRVHIRPNKAKGKAHISGKQSKTVSRKINPDCDDDLESFQLPDAASTHSDARQDLNTPAEVLTEENNLLSSSVLDVPELAPRQRHAPSWVNDYYVDSELDNVLSDALQQ